MSNQLERALAQLAAAVEDEGPNPGFHRSVVRETERDWPALMRAVSHLLQTPEAREFRELAESDSADRETHRRREKCDHGYYLHPPPGASGAQCPHGCSELVDRERHRGPAAHAVFDQKQAEAIEQLRSAGAFLLATTKPDDPLGVDVAIALGGRLPEGTHKAVAQAFLLALHDRIETMIEELAPPEGEEERGWVRRWLGH